MKDGIFVIMMRDNNKSDPFFRIWVPSRKAYVPVEHQSTGIPLQFSWVWKGSGQSHRTLCVNLKSSCAYKTLSGATKRLETLRGSLHKKVTATLAVVQVPFSLMDRSRAVLSEQDLNSVFDNLDKSPQKSKPTTLKAVKPKVAVKPEADKPAYSAEVTAISDKIVATLSAMSDPELTTEQALEHMDDANDLVKFAKKLRKKLRKKIGK